MSKYEEIKKLHKYCEAIGVYSTLAEMYDGFSIVFKNGDDFVQHSGSYGCDIGCVEPAIGSRLDYTAVTLKSAKALVKYHKDRLNKEIATDEQK